MQANWFEVVLGSNQRKELHPTSSTTCIDVNEQDIVAIVPKEIHLVDTNLTTLEGTVLSVHMLSFTIKHSCTEFSAFIKAGSGFYCCPSCNVVVPWQVSQHQNQIFHFLLIPEVY